MHATNESIKSSECPTGSERKSEGLKRTSGKTTSVLYRVHDRRVVCTKQTYWLGQNLWLSEHVLFRVPTQSDYASCTAKPLPFPKQTCTPTQPQHTKDLLTIRNSSKLIAPFPFVSTSKNASWSREEERAEWLKEL